MQKVILSLFCPILVAIIIRVILFIIAFVLGLLGFIFNAGKEYVNFVSNIGTFDTFVWNESWLFWGLVVIITFVVEMIIWNTPNITVVERENEEKRLEETKQQIVSMDPVEEEIIETIVQEDEQEIRQINEETTQVDKDTNPSFDSNNRNELHIKENEEGKTGDVEELSIPYGTLFVKPHTLKDYPFVKYVNIPSTVTTICENAFRDSQLEIIIIPDTVILIGEYAFSGCTNLKSIIIPRSVKSIGDGAFSGCRNLKSIDLSDSSVTTIGESAFGGCSELANLVIPNSVTSIGNFAFSSCLALQEINIPDSVTHIGDSLFMNSEIKQIKIHQSTANFTGHTFAYCNSLEIINVDSNNPEYISIDGILFNRTCSTLIKMPQNHNATVYEIPNSVIVIGDAAFEGCTNIEKVIIPDSVKEIGYSAFKDCSSLVEVVIPDSIEIGMMAFGRCYSLSDECRKMIQQIETDKGYSVGRLGLDF